MPKDADEIYPQTDTRPPAISGQDPVCLQVERDRDDERIRKPQA